MVEEISILLSIAKLVMDIFDMLHEKMQLGQMYRPSCIQKDNLHVIMPPLWRFEEQKHFDEGNLF